MKQRSTRDERVHGSVLATATLVVGAWLVAAGVATAQRLGPTEAEVPVEGRADDGGASAEPAPSVAGDGGTPTADPQQVDAGAPDVTPADVEGELAAEEQEDPLATELDGEAEAEADGATEAERTNLSEVVVTALRREQRARDVPIAMNVVGREQVLDQNVTTSNEVERSSPNLSAQASSGRSSRPRWFLRGIGTNDPSVNLESPVGIYQDESFIAFVPLQSAPIFDIERVEVLRGPQGTLWGKNTTGGAVHFVSRRPTFDPSGYLRLGIGSYGNRLAEGAFGGAVVRDRIAVRGAFVYEDQDGWATNLRTGRAEPQFNDFAARLQVLADVTDDFEILLLSRYRILNGGVNPIYPVGAAPDGTIRQYPEAPNTYLPPYGRDPDVGDPFFAGQGGSDIETIGASATLTYHVGDYTLTSITSVDVARLDSTATSYWPDTTFDQTGTFQHTSSRQISTELRFASPSEDRVSWIAGVSYFNWHLFNYAGLATFGPAAARRSYINNRFQQDNTAFAAFASLRARMAGGFSVSGGLRYTYDAKRVDAQRLAGRGATLTFNDRSNWEEASSQSGLSSIAISDTAKWSQLTFDITPEYRFSDDALVFLRFARGFRAGTFNPAVIPPAGEAEAYLPRTNPEVLWDFEAGARTSFFDDHLTIDLAAFLYLIDDVQLNVQQPNPGGIPGANTSIISNAASGTVYGGELEVVGRPIDDLSLRAGLGLIHTEYEDFLTFQGTETVDASGNRFYRAPTASLTFGGEYTLPINDANHVSLGTDWTYRSRIYHNAVVQDDPIQQTPGYVIGNAQLRYTRPREGITILAYVRNLTDTSWKVLSQVVNLGAYPTSLGTPRQFGLQAILRY